MSQGALSLPNTCKIDHIFIFKDALCGNACEKIVFFFFEIAQSNLDSYLPWLTKIEFSEVLLKSSTKAFLCSIKFPMLSKYDLIVSTRAAVLAQANLRFDNSGSNKLDAAK